MSDNGNQAKYGLFTAITMIAGIVIGSGIFFKADDVLVYTQGNVLLGILIFSISAIAIVFGSLSISQLATRTDKPGGIIAYAEEFVNPKAATALGWFQSFLYFGTLIPVVGYVAGIYICSLFGIEPTLMRTTGIGLACYIVIFIANMISAKLGGYIQNIALIIKLIPLIVIVIAGLVFGNPAPIIANDVETIKTAGVSVGVLAAFAPIAFSFDGWIVATSIGHEIKNSKRNLPIALIVSPIVILVLYVLYFVGMTSLVGTERVLELGNDAAYYAAESLFGATAGKVFIIFIIVSVLGTLNGLTLGSIRMPYSLATRNMFPASKVISKTSEKLNGMPINSAILTFIIALIWTAIRFISHKFLGADDISEIFVSISYVNFILLYVVIFKLAKQGEIKSKIMGYFVPTMAIIGSLIIITGSISSKLFIPSAIISVAVLVAGYMYGIRE